MRSSRTMVDIEVHQPERSARTVSLNCMGGCCCCCCLHSVGSVVGALKTEAKRPSGVASRASLLFWGFTGAVSVLTVVLLPVWQRWRNTNKYYQADFLHELLRYDWNYLGTGIFLLALIALPIIMLVAAILAYLFAGSDAASRTYSCDTGLSVLRWSLLGLFIWAGLPLIFFSLLRPVVFVPAMVLALAVGGFLLIRRATR